MGVSRFLDRANAGRWVPYYDPHLDPVRALALRHRRGYAALEGLVWLVAIVLDAADFVTTYLGVPHPMIVETVPLSRWMLVAFGWPGLLVEHVVALLLLVGLWRLLPRPYRIVVPAVGAVTGSLIVRGNVAELLEYGVLTLPW